VFHVPTVDSMRSLIGFVSPVLILKTIKAESKHGSPKYFYPIQFSIRYGVKLPLCCVPHEKVLGTGGIGPQVFIHHGTKVSFRPPGRVTPGA